MNKKHHCIARKEKKKFGIIDKNQSGQVERNRSGFPFGASFRGATLAAIQFEQRLVEITTGGQVCVPAKSAVERDYWTSSWSRLFTTLIRKKPSRNRERLAQSIEHAA